MKPAFYKLLLPLFFLSYLFAYAQHTDVWIEQKWENGDWVNDYKSTTTYSAQDQVTEMLT